MSVVFVNGKRMILPSSTTTAREIVRVSGDSSGLSKRAAFRKTGEGGIERMNPGQYYPISRGQNEFTTGPDRVKGSGETYFGNKEGWRKAVIADQVADVSEYLFEGAEVELDDDCNWVVFSNFQLPPAWARQNPGHQFVKMMLIFPDLFPDVPTNGFYLPDYVKSPIGEQHLFSRGFSGAFGESADEMRALAGAGWVWYCTHIKRGAWQPARLRRVGDWRNGDNLRHIITLAREVLTNPWED